MYCTRADLTRRVNPRPVTPQKYRHLDPLPHTIVSSLDLLLHLLRNGLMLHLLLNGLILHLKRNGLVLYLLLNGLLYCMGISSQPGIKYSHRLFKLGAIVHKRSCSLVLASSLSRRPPPLHAPARRTSLQILRRPQGLVRALVGGHPGDIVDPEGDSGLLNSSPVRRLVVLRKLGG